SQYRDPLVGRLAGVNAQRAVRTDPGSGKVRADGKIHLDAQGHLPVDPTGDVANLELAGVNGNWWIGLSVLHTLFAREHNAIVDRLRIIDYPAADGEWLFQKARLVKPLSLPRSTPSSGRRRCRTRRRAALSCAATTGACSARSTPALTAA